MVYTSDRGYNTPFLIGHPSALQFLIGLMREKGRDNDDNNCRFPVCVCQPKQGGGSCDVVI